METETTLPHFDICLDLYRTAYDQHGTDPFTSDQLAWDSPRKDCSHILDLSVAYGLLAFDGTEYRLRGGPEADENQWGAVLEAHGHTVEQSLLDTLGTAHGSDRTQSNSDGLTRDGRQFASVFVAESDDFDAVADTVGTVDLTEWDGVVLRSPGDYANEVQRFADRLSDESVTAELPFSRSLRKETSDVAGTDKDSLEFRLYMRADE